MGPHVVGREVDVASATEDGSCVTGELDTGIFFAGIINLTVRIVTDVGDSIPLGPSTPALPSGLFFVTDNI